MDKVYQLKKDLRAHLKKLRDGLSTDWVENTSRVIVSQLKNLPELKSFRTVHTYVAWRNEVNTHGLIKEWLGRGYRVAVPSVDLANRCLVHYEIKDFTDLEPGAFGILEPRSERCCPISLSEIDLVIVPGLAFDMSGHRLGFGGGYYDNFLQKISATKIALAYQVQIVDKIPTRSEDERVDIIVTEKWVHRVQ